MINAKKLKEGEKLSETQYYTVKSVNDDTVSLINDVEETIVVDVNYAEKCLISSIQFEIAKTMSRTDIINLFLASANTALTVNYNKQVDKAEVKKQLYNLYPNKGGKILSETEYQKRVALALSDALIGEERTMIGRHYGQQDEFGRVKFIDMEQTRDKTKDFDNRQRLVDTRTINWLILKGVMYKVK